MITISDKISVMSKFFNDITRVKNLLQAPGVDEDIKHPERLYRQLFADWRYIANAGYVRLKKGKTWGEWTEEDMILYLAKIVDALRSVYFPVIPPGKDNPAYDTPYWELYRKAEKYMKSKPPELSDIKEWDKKRKEVLKR